MAWGGERALWTIASAGAGGGCAIVAAITGTAPYAQAQTTIGTAGIGSTLWISKSCGGCHAPTAAPINAANAGGHITYAISNGMPTTATPTEANDLAAYLATFLLAPVTANVNQNSGANAIALAQLTLNTAYGKYTGIQVVAAPTRGSVTLSGTTATYTPTTDQFGADSFTYHAITAAGCTGSCSSCARKVSTSWCPTRPTMPSPIAPPSPA